MPAERHVQVRLTKLLIVEGRDEENFFEAALANHLGITDIQVLGIGGKTQLTANLKALKNDPAFPAVQCVAIVRDADLTPPGPTVAASSSAFASVCGSLTAQGVQLSCPAGHAQFAVGPPRVGVFIMPDGTSDGMLETLCTASVSGRPEYACVTDYFTCLQQHGLAPNNRHKGHAYAWLASQVDPDKRVGEAALAGYWPFANLWTFVQAM